MCGRFGMSVPRPRLSEAFPHVDFPLTLAPRFNIAPTQDVLALRQAGGRATAELVRWGLGAPGGAGRALINVRSETAVRDGPYRRLLQHERVVIPASHFYEWRGRRPLLIRPRAGLLAFAGLRDWWTDPRTGATVPAVTILTCPPNDLLRPVHSRMPVILDPAGWQAWLDPRTSLARVAAALVPCPDDRLEVLPASPLVNDHRNEGPELLEPVPEPPADEMALQLSLLDGV
jgi:putative SOS response-associated peptidase YedK